MCVHACVRDPFILQLLQYLGQKLMAAWARAGDILGRGQGWGNETEGGIDPVSKFLCFGTRLMM